MHQEAHFSSGGSPASVGLVPQPRVQRPDLGALDCGGHSNCWLWAPAEVPAKAADGRRCHRKLGIGSSVVSGFSLQYRKEGGEKAESPVWRQHLLVIIFMPALVL